MSKLRRQRDFATPGEIRSRRPTAANPAARTVAGPPPSPLAPAERDGAVAGSEAPSDGVLCDKILCGDSAAVLARLPAASVACAITSPPYWNTVDYGFEGQLGRGSYDEYRAGLTAVWREVSRLLQPNGKLCLNVPLLPLRKDVSAAAFGKTHTRWLLDLPGDLKADILGATDLVLYGLYVWEKQTTEKMFGSYPHPPNLYERNTVEFVTVFVKPGAPPRRPPAVKAAARLSAAEWIELTKQVWWIYPENVRRREGHPAPFPEALPNRLINMYTFPRVPAADFPGDLVLDPFAGWGTTCVAAKRCGRRYLGVEGSPVFCREAERRLAATELAPTVLRAERPQGGARS